MRDPLHLDDWGGTGPVLHLAHANGFPPATYRKLIEVLKSRHHVFTLRSRCLVPGADPRTLRDWDQVARQARRVMSPLSPRLATLALMLLVLTGCATGHAPGAFHSPESEGSAGGFFEKADAFQGVQEASGLEEESRHPAGAAISTEMARHLWSQVTKKPVTQQSFGPRRVLAWVLREALANGGPAAYEDLLRHTERFWRVVVMRPDGYLVSALTGRPLQRMGQVALVDGQYKVGRLVVGAFYFSNGGVLYPVDGSLQRSDRTPWAELGLERDWLNAALDGAEDAMVEMAQALAQSVLHPIRAIQGLQQLPSTVALLIASSPEYFERYRAMSLQDQIREAARLSTHLVLMYGGAAGTIGNFKGLEGLREQAQRQAQLAGGLRVRWHVAEPRLVPILQRHFKKWRVVGIEVVYTPPLPLP